MTTRQGFGHLPDGRAVERVELRSASSAVSASISTLGAAIHRVRTPDRDGVVGDVHLFHPTLDGYLDRATNPHLGGSVGRYANRIAGARFALDGRTIELEANDPPNHLHGGSFGFDRQLWSVVDLADQREATAWVRLGLHSPDGDAGYPGALDVTATFTLDGPTLTVAYEATTDAPTIVNLTCHTYWNLAGVSTSGTASHVGGHFLQVEADRYLPVDQHGIPIDGLAPVDGTPFDLRAGRTLADVLAEVDGGLDHSFALRAGAPDEVPATVVSAARLHDPGSGRVLEVASDQPAVQAYTGNHLRPPFALHTALSLETQRFPDTPNRPELGSARLDPGDRYRSSTAFAFAVA